MVRLLIDSGAFTNWKLGKETTVESYMEFLTGLPFTPWRYFTLDKIGDPKVTRSNYETMLKNGFKPVPIFTRGTPIREIDQMYDTSDLVGIGVGVGSNNYKGYLKYVVENNHNRPAHWLGVTLPNMVVGLRPYSCDSSNWESGGRWGQLMLFYHGKWLKYSRVKAGESPPALQWKIIRSLGYDPRDLQYEESWRGGLSSISRRLGCASWIRYSMEAERLFNTKIFLACSSEHGVRMCIEEYIKQKELIS